MKKLLILLCVLPFIAFGQQTGETQTEESMYTNIADTLVSFVVTQKPESQIVFSADHFILDRIPDSFSGKEIEKTARYKAIGKFGGYTWIRIEKFIVDQNRVFVFAKIQQQENDELKNWDNESSNCRLTYLLNQTQETYELVDFQAAKATMTMQ